VEALPEPADFVLNMLIALLGGVLVGLERERAQLAGLEGRKRGSIPGMRSFGILSIYGAVVAYASSILAPMVEGGWLILPVSLAVLSLYIGIHAYARIVKQKVLGITTYIVLLVTFFIGFLAGLGLRIEAVSLSVLVTLVLSLKHPAEKLAAALSYNELLAMLEVGAVALILGPVIKAYSEAAGFDLAYKVYVFFTVVLLISFVSYAAARIWGAKGIIYAAGLGSLVNSEATISSLTSIISNLSDPEARRAILERAVPLVIAVLQAKSAVLVVVALYIFSGTLPVEAVVASAALTLVAILVAFLVAREPGLQGPAITVKSPLSWSSAAKSALAYMILTGAFTLLAKTGGGGIVTILLAALGGLVNATATILSLATTLPQVGACTGLTGMLVAIASATVNKLLYARTGHLDRREYMLIVYWSLTMALVPLALAVLVYLNC